MSSPGSRDWTATVVIAFGDKRLDRMGLDLRDEIYSVLSRIDEPGEVVNAIFQYYETRGFEPSAAEREVQLNL